MAEAEKSDFGRYSLVMLLVALPYGLIFGHALGYRSLMFVPFFAGLCSEFLGQRSLKTIIAVFIFVNLVLIVDPITTDTLHTLAIPGGD